MKLIMIDQAHKSRRRTLPTVIEDLLYVVATVIAIVAMLATVVDVISIPDSAPHAINNQQPLQD
ncbi:MAG: hypothetical protein EPN17_00830 [Methylobacter sp.]|nr:MAG: hypothetical protein EPN17_00830 [Methylobacter sp.]